VNSLRLALSEGLEKILERYPQVSSPAVQAGVLGDFDQLLASMVDPGPVMKGPEGYGRYNDDPKHVGCPRAQSDMTPCVARDGRSAKGNVALCVGCTEDPADLLRDLVRAVTEPKEADSGTT
jgi:hypothetical protein